MRVYYTADGHRYHLARRGCLWDSSDVFHVDTLGTNANPITIPWGKGSMRTLTACQMCVTKEWGEPATTPAPDHDEGQTFHGGAETFK